MSNTPVDAIAIIGMSGALGMTTIAEGVETAAQERRLIDLGCGAGQGYRYSRPVPTDAVPDALRRALRTVALSPQGASTVS